LLNAGFGDGVNLIGYDFDPAPCPTGSCSRDLRLVWRANRLIDADYSIFIHALDSSGRIVNQADGPPASGRRPTSFWDAGEQVEDIHKVTLTPEVTRLEIGLYRLDTGARLPTSGGDTVSIELKK
jgi:hypothetical protein